MDSIGSSLMPTVRTASVVVVVEVVGGMVGGWGAVGVEWGWLEGWGWGCPVGIELWWWWWWWWWLEGWGVLWELSGGGSGGGWRGGGVLWELSGGGGGGWKGWYCGS